MGIVKQDEENPREIEKGNVQNERENTREEGELGKEDDRMSAVYLTKKQILLL